jgi:hypothetical protein
MDHVDPYATVDTARPRHVVRFGEQVDVKGVLAGSPEAEQCIGYLVKYLVKDLGDDLDPIPHIDDDHDDHGGEGLADRKAAAARRADHVGRLVEALRWERCSPSCPNWLRYGVQPKKPRPTMRPGCCKAKAHKPTHLGYGGRRVLVSRKWTAKDLSDHRHDRRAHVLAILGRDPSGQPAGFGESSATEPQDDAASLLWELAKHTDPDVAPLSRRLLRSIAHATRWRAEYRTARDSPPASHAHRPDSDPPTPTAA